MGGERETVVNASDLVKGDKTKVDDIRVHEKNGEVHFHADSVNLKAAVPCGIWVQAWLKLMDRGGTFNYVDTKRMTCVNVVVDINLWSFDAKIRVHEVNVGDTFKSLHEFTTARK
jgi:hypothetical protein